MDVDDLEPAKKKPAPKNLDEMSIEALGDYVEDLRAEIARAQAMIEDKIKARDAADSVFKS
ncbi:MAG: DUF1192 domain-containing protein [Rhodospirillales bacterium]|nr:DUF1192 domain-containing protein [Rhodospirillales bacterium]